ncbi:MAG: hypothetical protein KGK10_01620 [Rhodospirillales bacterium]|nr:hypothetical protein [Rhodospirillales bacterium]
MVAMLGLPSWIPWWLPLLVLVPGVAWLLAMLPMPFAVLGVRGRLEGIEARLDELQAEIRSLALRLPEPDPVSHRIPVPPRREIFTAPYPDEDEPRPVGRNRRGGERAEVERDVDDRPRDRRPPDPASRPRRLEPRLDPRR